MMAQESYADFSIIQKYLDQKRHHEEEVIKYKDKIAELGNTIDTLRDESNAKDQAISQLNHQLEESKSLLKEKDKNLQELSIQIHRFKKHIEQTQSETTEPITEEYMNKKAKFGFLKK
ncbi:hypothetical protein JW824_05720 [bacterium]|nr:hypothetical protein [bacterium]